MMKRLQCTYSQLLAEPAYEMRIFEAFAEGEAAVERAEAQASRNSETVTTTR